MPLVRVLREHQGRVRRGVSAWSINRQPLTVLFRAVSTSWLTVLLRAVSHPTTNQPCLEPVCHPGHTHCTLLHGSKGAVCVSVPAPRLTSTSSCWQRWLNFSMVTVPQGRFFSNINPPNSLSKFGTPEVRVSSGVRNAFVSWNSRRRRRIQIIWPIWRFTPTSGRNKKT